MSNIDVVIAVTGGADSLRTSLPSGQAVSIISASGQAIAGIVSALAPIGGAIAVNPAAGLITLIKIGLDIRDSRSIDVGDAVSLIGNSVSVVAAICAVVPGGQPLSLGLAVIGRALAISGIGLNIIGAKYPLDGPGAEWAKIAYDNARKAQLRRDPLVLDLDGDGLETTGAGNSGILFDHDGDGVKTSTGWIKADDGFLVLDRNGNGSIDNGSELFGDSTILASGAKAADGFAALRDLDLNADGVLNAQDAAWEQLRVWRDLNQDGLSQADELFTLSQLGITSLGTRAMQNSQILPDGNRIADLGTFVRSDGQTGTMGDVGQTADIDLGEDTFRREYSDTIPLRDDTKMLPDMVGAGHVRDLRQAASLDTPEGAALRSILAQYVAAGSRRDQIALLDPLVEAWAKTSDLNYNHVHAFVETWRAQNPHGTVALSEVDERLLAITSIFNGDTKPEELLTIDTSLELWGVRRDLLERSLEEVKDAVYRALLPQTRLKPYLDAITVSFTNSGSSRILMQRCRCWTAVLVGIPLLA